MAGVPVVAAVSAPPSLAVELAEEAGITLAGLTNPLSTDYDAAHNETDQSVYAAWAAVNNPSFEPV